MDDCGVLRGFDWEGSEDITALSEEELRDRLAALSEEESAVSYRLGILQGRMNLMRAELADRGLGALAPEELARVLLDVPPPQAEESP